ncbi:hypothetical protein ACFO0S_06775 [Chryseomicrobium palamuruense]|uniref:Uncharacterized protein n=1 Tax=Chryseomicrobium palamuruense TaxID=682973 RepID=A0ABV8UVI1_9BACL
MKTYVLSLDNKTNELLKHKAKEFDFLDVEEYLLEILKNAYRNCEFELCLQHTIKKVSELPIGAQFSVQELLLDFVQNTDLQILFEIEDYFNRYVSKNRTEFVVGTINQFNSKGLQIFERF